MPTVPEIITENVLKQLEQVDPSQSHLEETISRAECFLASDAGIWLTVLADVQSSQTTQSARQTRREKHADFVLAVQRVCERE